MGCLMMPWSIPYCEQLQPMVCSGSATSLSSSSSEPRNPRNNFSDLVWSLLCQILGFRGRGTNTGCIDCDILFVVSLGMWPAFTELECKEETIFKQVSRRLIRPLMRVAARFLAFNGTTSMPSRYPSIHFILAWLPQMHCLHMHLVTLDETWIDAAHFDLNWWCCQWAASSWISRSGEFSEQKTHNDCNSIITQLRTISSNSLLKPCNLSLSQGDRPSLEFNW